MKSDILGRSKLLALACAFVLIVLGAGAPANGDLIPYDIDFTPDASSSISWAPHGYFSVDDTTPDYGVPNAVIELVDWTVWFEPASSYIPFSETYQTHLTGLHFDSSGDAFGMDAQALFGPPYSNLIEPYERLTMYPADRTYYIEYSESADPYEWGNVVNFGTYVISVREEEPPPPVPEPATMLLLGSGLIGLAAFRRKFKKS